MDQYKPKNENIPIQYFDIGKMPPQAVDFEEAVLGALMIEKDSIFTVASILAPEVFYKDEHCKIYSAIERLFMAGKPIDLITVPEELRKLGYLDEIGGIAYITQLSSRVASAHSIEYHSRIVKQKYLSRELIRVSSNIQNMCFDESIDIDDAVDFALTQIYAVISNAIKENAQSISEIAELRVKELQEISKNENKQVSGVPSGFMKIDRITSGWQKTDLIIIGARPSQGKTMFGLAFSRIPAMLGMKVLFYSIEMSKRQICDRLFAMETGIENGYFRTGNLDLDSWKKVDEAIAKFESMGLYIDDSSGLTCVDFRAKSKLFKQKHNIELIIVDYLQLMVAPGTKDREQEISKISRTLKSVAKELAVPVIALAQLNRSVEYRSSKIPQLSDLRESGSMEQDADLVGFIHRPEFYGIKEVDGISTEQLIQFILAKHRNGPLAELNLWRSKNWSNIVDRIDYADQTNPEDNISGKNAAANDFPLPPSTDDLPF